MERNLIKPILIMPFAYHIVQFMLMSCQDRFYMNQQGLCEHYLFPPSLQTIIGSILSVLIAGFSSLAGVGGGTPHLVVIMILFNYTPKDSTIVIFSCILGTTLGNVLSQMKNKINDQPVIQYKYAFISIPIMFMGSFVGVLANKLLPSSALCLFIMIIAAISIKGIYQKFRISYQKQTEQNKIQDPLSSKKYIQTQYNPLNCQKNVYVLKNLLILIALYLAIACIKGTQKLGSIVNLQKCSITYWALYIFSFFIMGLFSYFNLQTLKKWESKPISLNEQNNQQNVVQQNIDIVAKNSVMAGIFSGFGLGGGLFLVPMYKSLGCNSLQATASCAFSIFVTACLNCIQGMLLGVIQLDDFLNFFILTAGGSYFMSSYLSKYLQRINRISIGEFVLLILVGLALINLPFSLYKKYQRSNYDSDILFGFGKIC